MGKPHQPLSRSCMFFAGLILLIPHRIGMSRVNYVIKRYNLPISRAGLLLYKYHNNIELSLLLGTLPGNVIVWNCNSLPKKNISYLMIAFLFLMLTSSIYMFIIYIDDVDFGHLNAFYFSLIFLTLFDGFANAFAFALNAAKSSMLSAGIPLSGFLVTLLHYIYKFFYDSFLWDDFDYHVLRLQLIFNILFILIALCLWSWDAHDESNNSSGDVNTPPLQELFGSSSKDHRLDWIPIGMLAISLGTVYAFYPSIAPYSIIDFQYASIVELWILVISALLPLTFAILDYFKYGPGGKVDFIPSYITGIQVTHNKKTKSESTTHKITHGGIDCTQPAEGGDTGQESTNFHDYGTYVVQKGDQYHDGTKKDIPLGKAILTRNWWNSRTINASSIEKDNNWDDWTKLWNGVWLCAIPYILCIQIFMSMLHYPDSILSCFFNKPRRTVFISVLFNTLRELMQACAFAGAGKQKWLKDTSSTTDSVFEDYEITSISKTSAPSKKSEVKLTGSFSGTKTAQGSTTPSALTGFTLDINASSAATLYIIKADDQVNGTISATNKLITLFVMMFCVFTGDGYLQHYRRCCRDNWPTTGYNKYQSFFYWLRFGFKGGIKSITSSFTDLYYHNLRPQFISYA